jgi:peroxiredoxin
MHKESEITELNSGAARIFSRIDWTYVLLAIAVLVAVGVIFKLLNENAWLRAEAAKNLTAISSREAIQAGDIIPAFKTVDMNEKPADITFDGSKKYLIYVFSTSCGACAEQLPNWNRLASTAMSRGYVVKGISLGSVEHTREFFEDKEVKFEVLMMPNKSVLRSFRLASPPEVLLLSAQGTVDWVHHGAMQDQTATEVLAYLESHPANR